MRFGRNIPRSAQLSVKGSYLDKKLVFEIVG